MSVKENTLKRLVILLLFIGTWNATTLAKDFIHPGAINSKTELDFVKDRIREGAQPWKDEFDQLKGSGYATRGAHGLQYINSDGEDAEASRDDAMAAYAQALMWYFTDEEVYANRSIATLNSWSALQGFIAGSDQDRLQAGWIGSVFASAAEIMRGHPNWSARDVERFQAMFRRAFYPQLTTASTWNGNVDLTQIDGLMAIVVFNEDKEEFQKALDRLKIRNRAYFYLQSDGTQPAPIAGDGGDPQSFWSNPKRWVDGLTQETCRDNGHHSQFGIGSALHAAEIAWHQGVDVYGENQERYTAAMELLATQFLSGTMQGVSRDDTPTADRYDAWEVGYNHYHNRKGIALPNTEKLIKDQIRVKAPRAICNLVFDMLTHSGLPRVPSKAINPSDGSGGF
ncbi:MAG: alginate lyase family protein [Chthoniobacterales bacterium]